ncbi:MAG: hypothetical protein RMX96_26505 [Nostoc sp. ChiSLP02]|nr:hypothetical protein [Nostoc sp. DedSLP05]MDZ8102321.1 hypothetical protein [Nostoc sp. DedSLP01]MDZ8188396.1 hypothetical protein [Nostoc sp. ChiSLP02]
MGFYRQAEKTLRETNTILQSEPNSLLKVVELRSLGNVVQVTGDLETSQQILQQSLKVSRPKSFSQGLSVLNLRLRSPSAKISFQSTFQASLFQMDK